MNFDAGNHIDESDQLRYVDGELDEREIAIVEEHLASCIDCRDAVDDLAAASDSLTAFLTRADFPQRGLVYRGVHGGGWWGSSLAKAAVLVGLLAGLGVPAAMLLRASDGERHAAPAPQPDPLDAAIAGVASEGTEQARAGSNSSSGTIQLAGGRGLSVGRGVSVGQGVSAGRARAEDPGVNPSFTIEVSSWQAAGELRLLFSNSDVFIYEAGETGVTTAAIDTQRGLMSINTTAAARADHTIWVPSSVRPEDLTVRVAAVVVELSVSPFLTESWQVSVAGVVPTEVATVDLRRPEGAGRR